MSLVISLGSNIGDRLANLQEAKKLLVKNFSLIEESPIYRSPAVDYLDQPEFLNQVLSFDKPSDNPQECLGIALEIENKMGRVREISKGPRVIDIDLLFWGTETINFNNLQIPHPRLFERSFIVLPLKDLSIFNTLSKSFSFPNSFCNDAFPFKNV